MKDVKYGRAISIQQPLVEEILRGIKKYEFSGRPTKIKGALLFVRLITCGEIFAVLN